MKKNYISPKMTSLQIAIERPVAGSRDLTSTGDVTGITFGGGASVKDNIAPEVKSNNYSVWDDDWSN